MKIALIEPDMESRESIASAFSMLWAGVQVQSFSDSLVPVQTLNKVAPQLVILDLEFQGVSSFDVIKEIRLFSAVPIVALGQSKEVTAVIRSFDLGVDDYMVKPVHPIELLVRCRTIVKRVYGVQPERSLVAGLLRLDALMHRAYLNNHEVKLTRTENAILRHLMENLGRVATYASLAREIWGDEYPEASSAIRVYVERLRKKLGDDAKNPTLIFNETGLGYRLVQPDSSEEPSPSL